MGNRGGVRGNVIPGLPHRDTRYDGHIGEENEPLFVMVYSSTPICASQVDLPFSRTRGDQANLAGL